MQVQSSPISLQWGETPAGFALQLTVGPPGQQAPSLVLLLSDGEAATLSGQLDKYLMSKLGKTNGHVLLGGK